MPLTMNYDQVLFNIHVSHLLFYGKINITWRYLQDLFMGKCFICKILNIKIPTRIFFVIGLVSNYLRLILVDSSKFPRHSRMIEVGKKIIISRLDSE